MGLEILYDIFTIIVGVLIADYVGFKTFNKKPQRRKRVTKQRLAELRRVK